MKVLVTGGAGFIGSHVCDELLACGHSVCVLDNLDSQVHGPNGGFFPEYLNPEVKTLKGDICESVVEYLLPVDVVIHLAAKVGVGQSAYEISDYVWNNSYGTSMLLHSLMKYPPKKLIVASSMSVYGEGDHIEGEATPIATDEVTPVNLRSVYALTKYDQECMCLLWGEAYKIPTIVLRFFNVYGPRQSLSNPYTGAIAIFASRLLNGKPPIIYEDGLQSRDFVYVSDVVRGICLALESDVSGEVVNIGTGHRTALLTLAEGLAKELGVDIQPEITGQKRIGDVRHCWADISKAQRLLGYEPEVSVVEGIRQLVPWLRTQTAVDRCDEHRAEMIKRGLLV